MIERDQRLNKPGVQRIGRGASAFGQGNFHWPLDVVVSWFAGKVGEVASLAGGGLRAGGLVNLTAANTPVRVGIPNNGQLICWKLALTRSRNCADRFIEKPRDRPTTTHSAKSIVENGKPAKCTGRNSRENHVRFETIDQAALRLVEGYVKWT